MGGSARLLSGVAMQFVPAHVELLTILSAHASRTSEIGNRLTFGRRAGLARSKEDAHETIPNLLSDTATRIEPSGARLHDNVEQHHRDVGMLTHDLDGFNPGGCRDELKSTTVHPKGLET